MPHNECNALFYIQYDDSESKEMHFILKHEETAILLVYFH